LYAAAEGRVEKTRRDEKTIADAKGTTKRLTMVQAAESILSPD
jgi:hypothetical protein